MAYKLYFNSAAGDPPPVLIDGDPPVDQSPQIAQLTADLAAANATIAQFKAFRDTVIADADARGTLDAAKIEGKNLKDAAAGLPA